MTTIADGEIGGDVRTKLNAALAKVLAMPQVQEFYRNGGYEAGSTTPAEFASITRSTYDSWGAMVQQVGLVKQ